MDGKRSRFTKKKKEVKRERKKSKGENGKGRHEKWPFQLVNIAMVEKEEE